MTIKTDRALSISPKPPTVEDYRQLQRECSQLAEPFMRILRDLYAVSTVSIVYKPLDPNVLPVVRYSCDAKADDIRQQMQDTVKEHIAKFKERFKLEEPDAD